jgi:hypothetical protein
MVGLADSAGEEVRIGEGLGCYESGYFIGIEKVQSA